jgi:hypothetical protein
VEDQYWESLFAVLFVVCPAAQVLLAVLALLRVSAAVDKRARRED